ncbi:MAG: PAS domain S-box protein [Ignavibacteria bacterium]|jgi:PAS domain S-box-containing protein|nr:PAS domain S-box protein [Ignavibacteria bacterium]MCU7521838.1 PAS domain S-box protein [Ignavibacteria bacterium]
MIKIRTKISVILALIFFLNALAVISFLDLYLLIALEALVFSVVSVLLWKWVAVPVNNLYKSFQNENLSLILPLLEEKSEFGEFANFLTSFIKQRKDLEYGIRHRRLAESELKRAHIELEERVVQRTNELLVTNQLLKNEIEERKSIERSLTETEDNLRVLAETTKDVLYRLRYATLTYDYLSPAISNLTGYTFEEINQIGLAGIIKKREFHSQSNAEEVKKLRTDSGFKEYQADYLICRKNGELIWVSDHSFAWREKSGELIGSVGVLQDITKRKLSEIMLQRQDEILKAISFQAEMFLKSSRWDENIDQVLKRLGEAAQVSRVYIFRNKTDEEGLLLMQQLYEWTAEGIPPQIDNPILQELPYSNVFTDSEVSALRRNEVSISNLETMAPEGKPLIEAQDIKSLVIVPIFVGKNWWGFIGFDDCLEIRDWSFAETEALKTAGDMIGAAMLQNSYEDELIKAKQLAERSDRLKTDFLTQMSHEIRTPLNTILSYISLIKEDVESRNFEDLPLFFETVDNGGKRLIRTIDLILNMSQVQTGNIECKYAELDLSEEILGLQQEFSVIAERKGLELSFNNNAAKSSIIGDKYTVDQIFENIIGNAIKFTPSGKIDVNLYNRNGSVCVDVKDTGIGILKEYIPHLFSPFSQEETGYTRRFDGNGLGLALVKKYAELNEAEIYVQSEKGVGSTFTVSFKKF